MSSYAEVDAIIAKWVEAVGSALNTEWADEPARFFYIPGDPPFECFQISVDPPKDGSIRVHARAVDTNDDTEDELKESWKEQQAELDNMLASAVHTVTRWKARVRKAPDPASPW
jgi:hypothetical protein